MSNFTYTYTTANPGIQMESQENIPAELKKKLVFTYDYMGRRIGKAVYAWIATSGTDGSYAETVSTSNSYIYDGWNMILGDGNRYFWGLDLSNSLQGAGGVGGLLGHMKSGTSSAPVVLYTYDGNGNIVDVLKPSGSTTLNIAHYEYTPFGELIRTTTTNEASPFQFSTKYTDSETGLVAYEKRYYNPSTGGWLSRDPIGERGGVNLYAFVGNDPVDKTDRLGLEISSATVDGGPAVTQADIDWLGVDEEGRPEMGVTRIVDADCRVVPTSYAEKGWLGSNTYYGLKITGNITIKYRWRLRAVEGVDTHEAFHKDIYKRAWNEIRSTVNPLEGNYGCGSEGKRCRNLAGIYAEAYVKYKLASAHVEHLLHDPSKNTNPAEAQRELNSAEAAMRQAFWNYADSKCKPPKKQ